MNYAAMSSDEVWGKAANSTGGIGINGNATEVNTGVLIRTRRFFFSPPSPVVRCLPLLGISVDIEAQEGVSRSKVVQTFWNPSDVSLMGSSYRLPLSPGTVLESLSCTVGEEDAITGQVEAREEAKAAFDQAEKQDSFAALAEETPAERIEVRLANIPPQEIVRVEICYLSVLQYNTKGDIIVAIPRSIAPTVSSLSREDDIGDTAEEVGLNIRIHMKSVVPIANIHSGHRPISVQIGPSDTLQDQTTSTSSWDTTDHTSICVTFSSTKSDLGDDFLLTVVTIGEPLAVISDPSDGDGGHAMMVHFSPEQLFPEVQYDISPVEYILVADTLHTWENSASDLSQQAILTFLTNIEEGSFFNVYTVGTEEISLWDQSQDCSISDLKDVIPQFLARPQDRGNQCISPIIQKAVEQRRNHSNTHVVVITSRGWEQDFRGIIDFVRNETLKSGNRLHFSALGIGNQMPGQLPQQIGLAGRGVGEVLRLQSSKYDVETAIMNIIEVVSTQEYNIDLDVDQYDQSPESSALARTESDVVSKAIRLYDSQLYTQAPYRLNTPHRPAWCSLFLLFKEKCEPCPSFVTIKATMASGEAVTHQIPITRSSLRSGSIHRLAAKAIMNDMENHRSFLHELLDPRALSPDSKEDLRRYVKDFCTRTSLQWSIPGKWASFVAVGRQEPTDMMSPFYEYVQYMQSTFMESTLPGIIWGMFEETPQQLHDGAHAPRTTRAIQLLGEGESTDLVQQVRRAVVHETMEVLDEGARSLGHHPDTNTIQPQKMIARLRVARTANNDSSRIELSSDMRNAFGLRPDDFVLVHGKQQKTTIKRVAIPFYENQEYGSAGLSDVVCANMGLKYGQTVTIYRCGNLPPAEKIVLSPSVYVKDVAKTDLMREVSSYFRKPTKPRPIHQGEIVTLQARNRNVDFQVTSIKPLHYGLVVAGTVIALADTVTRGGENTKPSERYHRKFGGYDKQLAEIQEVLELGLQKDPIADSLGIALPRTILLYGPRGTGKSLIGQAIQEEIGASFFTINGKKLASLPLGGAMRQLNQTFAKAVRIAPSVIFIDDIDILAPRTTDGRRTQLASRLSYLLESLQNVSSLVVIATTCQPELLDTHLCGRHRFSRKIQLGLPNDSDRLKILGVHTKYINLHGDVNLAMIAQETDGFVGSDLAALCSEAVMIRAREMMSATGSETCSLGVMDCDCCIVSMGHFRSGAQKILDMNRDSTEC
ncbi:hypothetical protein PG995_005099 [Apiospora arundinis]